jgi:hypothetical protein
LIELQNALLKYYKENLFNEDASISTLKLIFPCAATINADKNLFDCDRIGLALRKVFRDGNCNSLSDLNRKQKNFLMEFVKTYNQFIKQNNNINYLRNMFPQTTQGHNFFTNQCSHFYIDHSRNFGFDNTKIRPNSNPVQTSSSTSCIPVNSDDEMNFTDSNAFKNRWLA